MEESQQQQVMPTYDSLLLPTVDALHQLGGSGTVDEILKKVAQILNLSDTVLSIPHGDTSQNELAYRLAWSRTWLKIYGLIENSSRGVWALTSAAQDTNNLDSKQIVLAVREAIKSKVKPTTVSEAIQGSETVSEPAEEMKWHEQLHKILFTIDPSAFERLIQRLLRESGFTQVEV